MLYESTSRASDIAQAFKDRLQLNSYYKDTFVSVQGQKVLEHLCKKAHVTGSSFVTGDPYLTAFNEGQRHIVMSILQFLYKNPNQLVQQIQKQYEDPA